LRKYENLIAFYVFNNTLLLEKFEDQRHFIMRTKGPFVKVVLLNEVVEHPLFKPNFDIGRFFDPFKFFSIYPYYLKTQFLHP
jgi:hypothetical protein